MACNCSICSTPLTSDNAYVRTRKYVNKAGVEVVYESINECKKCHKKAVMIGRNRDHDAYLEYQKKYQKTYKRKSRAK